MTLQYDQFKKLASEFVTISSGFGDEWTIKTIKCGPNEDIYLEKRVLMPDTENKESFHTCSNEIEQVLLFKIFTYHIVYNHSYSVPMLCFNANYEDGKLLSIEEIWAHIPKCYDKDSAGKWDMLTQQEHPKLGIPCFSVHPCYTADFMSHIKSANYIISWLSVVAPLVGLSLPLEYAKFT